jgi:predicted DNA binding CopG/RHH family protein
MQNSVAQPVKKNEKKEQKRQSIHQKFSSKYQQYSTALRLNPEIANFNQKELREHFSQPQINYYKKLATIEMRFGSSDIDQIDFEKTQASIEYISKKLGLKYYSVVTIIRRFRLQRKLKTKRQIIRK